MADIPLAQALLLWNSGFSGAKPAFAVRPLGHDDYWVYDGQNGACEARWQKFASESPEKLLLLAMVELWHIAAFYKVPVEMIHKEMLVVPEYRKILADDCLPKEWQLERGI